MEQKFNDERAIQYLLGQLSAREQEQFEERYFTDDAFFENLLAVKSDLTDLYARGELSKHQLERVEKYFLASPRRRQSLEATKRLIAAASQQPAGKAVEALPSPVEQESIGWGESLVASLHLRSRPAQFALAALGLIALVLGVWWWMASPIAGPLVTEQPQTPGPQTQPTAPSSANLNPTPQITPQGELEPDAPAKRTVPSPTPSTEQAGARPSPVIKPPRSQQQRSSAASIASITMTPVLTRNPDDSPALVIRPETTTVRLQLVFKNDDYRSYQAVVRTVDGDEVHRLRGLKARKSMSGSRVSIDLPAKLLTRQDYFVTLSGVTSSAPVEEIGEYYLKIEKTAPGQNHLR